MDDHWGRVNKAEKKAPGWTNHGVKLSHVGLGDSVRIQYTEAIAIEVVKP